MTLYTKEEVRQRHVKLIVDSFKEQFHTGNYSDEELVAISDELAPNKSWPVMFVYRKDEMLSEVMRAVHNLRKIVGSINYSGIAINHPEDIDSMLSYVHKEVKEEDIFFLLDKQEINALLEVADKKHLDFYSYDESGAIQFYEHDCASKNAGSTLGSLLKTILEKSSSAPTVEKSFKEKLTELIQQVNDNVYKSYGISATVLSTLTKADTIEDINKQYRNNFADVFTSPFGFKYIFINDVVDSRLYIGVLKEDTNVIQSIYQIITEERKCVDFEEMLFDDTKEIKWHRFGVRLSTINRWV